MEKYIHRLSFVLTFVLFYGFATYMYLSYKGFVYQNGTFELVKKANAFVWDENVPVSEETSFATPIDANIALNLPTQNVAGSQKAPITIYEFSSLGCSHCADFHLNILPKLTKDYFDADKVKLVFVDFPLDKKSMQASMLAHCLNQFDRADFLRFVFSKQREWGWARSAESYLIAYAKEYGLSAEKAEMCLKNDAIAKEILFNRQEAIDKLHIDGTPAFLVSDINRNEMIYGVLNLDDLKAYLDDRLAALMPEKEEMVDD